MAEQKNAVATVDALAGDFLQKFGKSLADYAVRKYDETGFLKSAMIAIVDNPDLAAAVKTDQGKQSLFSALRYAATTGLSLNPQEGKSCLIPYGGKIQYQVMKNGMVDLALESGKVDYITSEYVRKNDGFTVKKTSSGDTYEHTPAISGRGELLGFYAALKIKGGATYVKYMSAEEIAEHRKKYSDKSRMPETGYGLKTVMKALLRNISISTELDTALGADDFFEADFTNSPGVSADEAVEKLKADKKPEVPAEKESLL